MDGILSSHPVFSGTWPTHLSEGPSPTVPHCPQLSSAVLNFFPLFSALFLCPPPSLAVLHHHRPSPTVPYQIMSQIVGLVILLNDCRPGNSRMRTDGILSSLLVPWSWQSPSQGLWGLRKTTNTNCEHPPPFTS